MWDDAFQWFSALAIAVAAAWVGRGSQRWRELSTARDEIELAALLDNSELAARLRTSGERRIESHLQDRSIVGRARIAGLLALVLSFLVIVGISTTTTALFDTAVGLLVTVPVGVIVGFTFDRVERRLARALEPR